MSLAQRIRDYRYAKGWGPDELASRAEISRTALYQIESGKTELPRAGTLRRIALALEISTEALLGQGKISPAGDPPPASERKRRKTTERAEGAWYPSEGAPLSLPPARPSPSAEDLEGARFAVGSSVMGGAASEWLSSARERELTQKLHQLLASPLGEGVARIVEEAYRMLSYTHASSEF